MQILEIKVLIFLLSLNMNIKEDKFGVIEQASFYLNNKYTLEM